MRATITAGIVLILMLSGAGWSQEETDFPVKEKILRMEMSFPNASCNALLALDYYQKNTLAHVESTLTNEDCGASHGSYTIRVRYLPDDGELTTVEFDETWSRDDDQDVRAVREYYIGENLEIRRISSSQLRCSCTEAASGESE